MKVYLAGKIEPNGWRNQVISEDEISMYDFSQGFRVRQMKGLGSKYDQHICTGPFFLAYNHGTSHGEHTHGLLGNEPISPSRHAVVAICLNAILNSDVVFAWFDRDTWSAYGTIAELGYAKALGTPIWLAGSEPNAEQWFMHEMADRAVWGFDTPANALRWYFDHSAALPQSATVYLRQAADDPEAVKARRLFAEFGPPGVRVPIPKHVRAAVWAKTGGTCWYCKLPTNPYEDFQVDHVMPVSKGGANRIDNLVPCCQSCNAKKSNGLVVLR